MSTHQSPQRERARRLAPEERRAALLDAATELFIAQGPGFTTADLAAAAEVSEGTIFRYFPDKPTLVAECRQRAIGLEDLLPELAAAAELPTLAERVRAASLLLDARIPQMIQVVSDGGTRDATDDAGDIAEQLVAALSPVFDGPGPDGPEATRAGPERPAQLANLLIGLLISNTFLCEKSSTPSVPVDRLVEIFLHGVANIPGGNPSP